MLLNEHSIKGPFLMYVTNKNIDISVIGRELLKAIRIYMFQTKKIMTRCLGLHLLK